MGNNEKILNGIMNQLARWMSVDVPRQRKRRKSGQQLWYYRSQHYYPASKEHLGFCYIQKRKEPTYLNSYVTNAKTNSSNLDGFIAFLEQVFVIK